MISPAELRPGGQQTGIHGVWTYQYPEPYLTGYVPENARSVPETRPHCAS